MFETAECEEVRNSIFWMQRYEKYENQMKGFCAVELKVNLMMMMMICSAPFTYTVDKNNGAL